MSTIHLALKKSQFHIPPFSEIINFQHFMKLLPSTTKNKTKKWKKVVWTVCYSYVFYGHNSDIIQVNQQRPAASLVSYLLLAWSWSTFLFFIPETERERHIRLILS